MACKRTVCFLKLTDYRDFPCRNLEEEVGRKRLEEYVEGGFQSIIFGKVPFVLYYHAYGSKANFGFYGQDRKVRLELLRARLKPIAS